MVGKSASQVTTDHRLPSCAGCVLSGRLFQLGHIEGEPGRRGMFPVTFVHFITD